MAATKKLFILILACYPTQKDIIWFSPTFQTEYLNVNKGTFIFTCHLNLQIMFRCSSLKAYSVLDVGAGDNVAPRSQSPILSFLGDLILLVRLTKQQVKYE